MPFSAEFDDEFPHIDGRRAGEMMGRTSNGVNEPQFRRMQRLAMKPEPLEQRPKL